MVTVAKVRTRVKSSMAEFIGSSVFEGGIEIWDWGRGGVSW